LLLPLTLRQSARRSYRLFHGWQACHLQHGALDRDFAANATAIDLDALISGIRQRSEADVLALDQQPLRWRDFAEPMALLPNQASVTIVRS